nr:DUF6518 family protein [Nocardioides luteus]
METITEPISAPTGAATTRRVLVLAASSLVLGGLTSYAQGFLPDALRSFANSASGWTLLTVLLVLWSRTSPAAAALLAVAGFVLLVLGYMWVSDLRGYYFNPVYWCAVGVVTGPFVGLATAWLRTSGLRASLGTAALAGLGIGEGVYGLTVVRETTSPVYWVIIIVTGVALLAYQLARRIKGTAAITSTIAATAAVAIAFTFGYPAIGSAVRL